MPILTLAAKDLRLLLRDARSAVILLVTPLVLILVLGMALGEGFWEKPDEKLHISVVNLDRGLAVPQSFPGKKWSEVVIDDLGATEDIRLELIPDEATARRLIEAGSRAAVLVFDEDFSERMNRASFLSHGDPPPINPFDRDGVRTTDLGVRLLKDPGQPVSAAVIEQVTQVTLMRVTIPWMIGRAFQRVGDDAFMKEVADRLTAPTSPKAMQSLDPVVQELLKALFAEEAFNKLLEDKFGKAVAFGIKLQMPQFREVVRAAFKDEKLMAEIGKKLPLGEVLTKPVRDQVGPKVKAGVKDLFSNYDFEATTWGGLNKKANREADPARRAAYRDTSGMRYQILVPSYTVMFAFFLVLSVGWLFVAERKHGTLARLRAAPLTRSQILLGKLLPCLAVSLAQGFFLLVAGRLLFNMTWGSRPDLLLPVVVCTSFAAVGLAVLVASVARTETQVAVYGTLLVLVLGGISGSLMPRDLMPENMKTLSLVTPHAWALDAYSQLLARPNPDPAFIATACGALLAFGAVFTLLAWWLMDVDG